jgi:hypothetical protein
MKMRIIRDMLTSVLIAVFLLLNLHCARVSHLVTGQQKEGVAITLGEGQFGLVKFPDDFSRKKVTSGTVTSATVITTLRYEIRRRSSSNELVFRMSDHLDDQGNPAESEDVYAVTLDGHFKTRVSTEDEWKAAETVSSLRRGDDVTSMQTPAVKDGRLERKGKWYPIAGKPEAVLDVFPSPNGRWLAVLSDTSEPSKLPGSPLGFGQGGRTKGEMFIEIFDTTSGEKVVGRHVRHNGSGAPGTLFNNSLWLENRYFVVPIDPPGKKIGSVGRDCLLAIVPAQ